MPFGTGKYYTDDPRPVNKKDQALKPFSGFFLLQSVLFSV
jgi:hypothetical protein